jgi:heat shock protein HtpX
MPETPEPILVYRRIASNKRATRLLLASFPVALLPLVAASTVVLASIAGTSLLASLIVSMLSLIVAVGVFVAYYGQDMVLRLARARPLCQAQEPELVRTVENLCIGAGLPVLAIHLVESPAPNALATGSDPEHASLVVTRGLLRLLDHRELEGVIAHELSHIGNHDTRLTTMLTALIGIACIPIAVCAAVVRHAWTNSVRRYGELVTRLSCAGTVVMIGGGWLLLHPLSPWVLFGDGGSSTALTSPRSVSPVLMGLSVVAAPFYVLFLSPLVALLIGQAVSQEREYLADADAVRLTRHPEGLALALTKVSSAHASPLSVGEGCVHLYFVDPLETAPSLLHNLFPSHPPVLERIQLLARMGSIDLSALEAAAAASNKSRQTESENLVPDPPRSSLDDADAPSFVVPEPLTAVYERPDGWSRVLTHLPKDAEVRVVGNEGHFVRVMTKDNVSGYIGESARQIVLKR